MRFVKTGELVDRQRLIVRLVKPVNELVGCDSYRVEFTSLDENALRSPVRFMTPKLVAIYRQNLGF